MNIIFLTGILTECVGAYTATKLTERAVVCINVKIYMKIRRLSSKLQPLFRQRAISKVARRNDFYEN